MKNIKNIKKCNPNIIIKTIKFMVCVSIFLLVISTVNQKTFAKYITQVIGQVNGNIAKPIIEILKQESIEVDILQGKNKYQFEVKNFDKEGNLNEVEMKYYIEIIPKTTKNISYELYKQSQENEQLEKIKLQNLKTDFMELTNKEEQTIRFALEIKTQETQEIQETQEDNNKITNEISTNIEKQDIQLTNQVTIKVVGIQKK